MPIRRSPNRIRHTHPQVPAAGRDRPERVVAINRNRWSSSIVIGGRDQSVRAHYCASAGEFGIKASRSGLIQCCVFRSNVLNEPLANDHTHQPSPAAS